MNSNRKFFKISFVLLTICHKHGTHIIDVLQLVDVRLSECVRHFSNRIVDCIDRIHTVFDDQVNEFAYGFLKIVDVLLCNHIHRIYDKLRQNKLNPENAKKYKYFLHILESIRLQVTCHVHYDGRISIKLRLTTFYIAKFFVSLCIMFK